MYCIDIYDSDTAYGPVFRRCNRTDDLRGCVLYFDTREEREIVYKLIPYIWKVYYTAETLYGILYSALGD